MLFHDDDSDADDASAPSTNGDWAVSDEENEDVQRSTENVGVQVIQEVESTRDNGEPVDDEIKVVTSEVLAPMPTMLATVPQQCAFMMTQLDLLKTQKKNVSNDTSLIPGFKLTIRGRDFYLLPIGNNTRSWEEYRTNVARKKRGKKESNIRSKLMLNAYLEYLYAKGGA